MNEHSNVVNMLWLGETLGYLEELSIVSFLQNRFAVHLYTYQDVARIPAGVEVRDASGVVDPSVVARLTGGRRGSRAMFANYFRYTLQKLGRGLWCDTDMVCIGPFMVETSDVLFGYQSGKTINNAVLFIPASHPMTDDLLNIFADNFVPPWLDLNRKRQLYTKRLLRMPFGPTDQHWGTFGPGAVTAMAKKHRVFDRARPIDTFYPVPYTNSRAVFEPGTDPDQFLTENTLALHLWNETIKDLRGVRPAQTSAVGKLMHRYGI